MKDVDIWCQACGARIGWILVGATALTVRSKHRDLVAGQQSLTTGATFKTTFEESPLPPPPWPADHWELAFRCTGCKADLTLRSDPSLAKVVAAARHGARGTVHL